MAVLRKAAIAWGILPVRTWEYSPGEGDIAPIMRPVLDHPVVADAVQDEFLVASAAGVFGIACLRPWHSILALPRNRSMRALAPLLISWTLSVTSLC